MTSQFDLDQMAFNLECTEERLNQLAALFSVIVDKCENKEVMPTALLMRIKALAGLGWSSADDWSESVAMMRSNLEGEKQKEAA